MLHLLRVKYPCHALLVVVFAAVTVVVISGSYDYRLLPAVAAAARHSSVCFHPPHRYQPTQAAAAVDVDRNNN